MITNYKGKRFLFVTENHKSSPPTGRHPEINSDGLTTRTGDDECNFTAE